MANDGGTRYWRVYNILVRILGLAALLSGIWYISWGAVRIWQLTVLQTETESAWVLLAVGLLVTAVGAEILRTPAYRPDLGDASWHFDPLGKKTARVITPGLSWWTGDRRAAGAASGRRR